MFGSSSSRKVCQCGKAAPGRALDLVGDWIWLETREAQPITILEEEGEGTPKQQPPLVDARVLEVVAELQRAVGGTDALIDLLWSVGSAYGIRKDKAS